MCAILGIVGGTLPTKEKVMEARDTMIHRGPDDCGLYYEPKEGVALGHRRLSIIDLTDAGKQPFFSHDRRYVIVYNGEIYNYKELKAELAPHYPFKTETDTEVLLAAYIHWKEHALNKLNGMFAFAVWDRHTKALFAARDRLGVKPFYYMIENGSFIFASEVKALLFLKNSRAKPNESIIFDYLCHGMYDHRSETFFESIEKLPQGAFLVWKDGHSSIKKYWDLGALEGVQEKLNFNDAKDAFKELVADSIRLRFRSDVPVGIDLSSGLDSNSLLYYSKQVTGRDVDTFTMCLPSEEYNECSLLEKTLTEKQKTHWHTSYLKPEDVFPLVEKTNIIQGEPFAGIPTIAYHTLNREAKKAGVTVLLEGQGLDELLAGYAYFRVEYEKDLGKNSGENSSVEVSQDRTKLIYRNILNADFIRKWQNHKLGFKAPFSSHLLNAQYRDLFYAKMPRELRFLDHMSMAYGRELRVPFLDYRIVEFCFFLSHEYKIKEQEQKVLVREAMREYVPHNVRERPKKSFGAVQTEWFRKYHQEEIRAVLKSSSFRNRPYWNQEKVVEKIETFFSEIGGNSFFIWQCVNLELWFREFID